MDSAVTLVSLVGAVIFLALALWFWRRGQTASTIASPRQANGRDGDTVLLPVDQMFADRSSSRGGDTEFIDPDEAFRLVDRNRAAAAEAQSSGSKDDEPPSAPTEFIPHDEVAARIGRR